MVCFGSAHTPSWSMMLLAGCAAWGNAESSWFSLNIHKHCDALIGGCGEMPCYTSNHFSYYSFRISLNINLQVVCTTESYEKAFWNNGSVFGNFASVRVHIWHILLPKSFIWIMCYKWSVFQICIWVLRRDLKNLFIYFVML